MRAPLLVALLMGAGLAGCAADEPTDRLAQPTDRPVTVPTQANPRPPTASYNFSDPGYRMTAPWRAGDGWDYESNESRYRRVRVLDSRLMNGVTYYIVEEKTGLLGQAPERTAVSWVNGRDYTVLNTTDQTGALDRFDPGVPQRHFRNGSFVYNHTRTESSGRLSLDQSVLVSSRLSAGHQTVLFQWGYVEARRVEQNMSVRESGGPARNVGLTIHWVHSDYLNDVQYQLPNGEVYKIVAAKAGDFRRGKLTT